MVRISKDPEERKKELIDAAEKLFIEKGYEQTQVSDIVKSVGVAQGTFYYYFKSKDEVLGALIDNYLKIAEDNVREVINDSSMSPIERLEKVASIVFGYSRGKEKLIDYMHMESNLLLHERAVKNMTESFTPMLTGLIEEGKKEGVFDVQYPRQTVEMLVMMFAYLHDSLFDEDKDEQYKKIKAAEVIIERSLGAKKGSIRLIR